MRNCELLKKFYEENNDLIQIVDNLVLDTVSRNSTSNMGGKYGTLEYRLIRTPFHIMLSIFENDMFYFAYSMDFEDEHFDYCSFYGEPLSAIINFGLVKESEKIWVQDKENVKILPFPISEEQYFQYLTIFDLSSEELYQYFLDIKKEHKCFLELFAEDSTGFERFSEVINQPGTMKKVLDDIKLVEFAMRRTA